MIKLLKILMIFISLNILNYILLTAGISFVEWKNLFFVSFGEMDYGTRQYYMMGSLLIIFFMGLYYSIMKPAL